MKRRAKDEKKKKTHKNKKLCKINFDQNLA